MNDIASPLQAWRSLDNIFPARDRETISLSERCRSFLCQPMPCCMQTKQIVDQALKGPNPIGGGTGAFAERRAAQDADLMRHKTLLVERSQSAPAGWASVSKLAAVAKARDSCGQAPASAKIKRFVLCQTGRAELQPGNLSAMTLRVLTHGPEIGARFAVIEGGVIMDVFLFWFFVVLLIFSVAAWPTWPYTHDRCVYRRLGGWRYRPSAASAGLAILLLILFWMEFSRLRGRGRLCRFRRAERDSLRPFRTMEQASS